MQTNDTGGLAFFKMATDSVPDVGPEFLPGVGLRDDGLAEGAGDEAAFGFGFVDFKNDLVYGFAVSRAGTEREVRLA